MSKDTPFIIGLLGRARSGKDTIADYLEEVYGYTRIAFADPMRAITESIASSRQGSVPCPDPRNYQRGSKAWRDAWEVWKSDPRWDMRSYLQGLGEGCREVLGSEVWLEALRRQIYKLDSPPYVITDVRRANECQFIRGTGHYIGHEVTTEIWHVDRPDQKKIEHHTEDLIEYLAFKHKAGTLHNSGTIEDLQKTVDVIMGLRDE